MSRNAGAQKKLEASVPPTRIKILSIGNCGTGKSCLIKRYCEERFVSKYITTIGVDYGVKPVQIDGCEVRVNFWDLSGHPDFFEIRNEFYKDAQGLLLVYDASERTSFEDCDIWLAEAAKYGASPATMSFVLCANKVDKKRAVTEEEGKAYAAARNLSYFETSSMSGANVQQMFESTFRTVLRSL